MPVSLALPRGTLKDATPSAARPSIDGTARRPERFALVLLGATAILAPLCLGCTGEWPRLGVEAVMTAVVIAWAVSAPRPWLALVVPMLASGPFLLQLLPLPDRLLTWISPVSAGAWKVAVQGHPGTVGSISLTPAATLVGICRLLLWIATVVAVADLARRPGSRQWLLWPVAVSVVLAIALGVVFPVDYDDRVLLGFIDLKGPLEFWRSPLPPPAQTAGWAYLEWATIGAERHVRDLTLVGDGFGSFISSNAFAAAVHLGLPALLAAFMVLTRHRLPDPARHAMLLAAIVGAAWVVGGMAKSRAGAAGLVLGGLVYASLAMERPLARRICGIVTAALAAGMLAFVLAFHGFLGCIVRLCPPAWQHKLFEMTGDGRVAASQVALRMFRASPALGTGLGSYGDLHARMAGGRQVMYFAHNDYAQFLAEGGLVALTLMLAGVVVLARAARRFAALPCGTERLEIAAGWAALAALAVHSAFDWNMHVPVNAFLACLMAGVALSASPPLASSAPASGSVGAVRGRTVATVGLVTACVVAFALLGREATSEATSRQVREALVADELAAKDPAQPDPVPVLLTAVGRGERAMARDPRNASLAVVLGQGNLRLAARATGSARDAYRSAAERWFDRAKTAGAMVRGLPEPVPPPSVPPKATGT